MAAFDPSALLSFAPDVVVQVIDGEALILKLHDEDVFTLNATGTRIAELIVDHQSVGSILDALSAEYDKSRDELAPEVNDLLRTLLAKRLIVVESSR